MDSAIVVVVTTVVVAVGLVLAVQVLARVLAGQSFEAPWRPLATFRRATRSAVTAGVGAVGSAS